jgi:phage shock protein A
MYYNSVAGLRNALIGAECAAVSAYADAAAARRSAVAHRERAEDAQTASAIHSAASRAYSDGNTNLFRKLLASDARVEQLEDQVDDLLTERTSLIGHCASLLDEVAMLRRKLAR